MKKVSVVVPCYNAAVYLDKCMEYLLKQTIGIDNIEIILVDDASTDNGATWEIIIRGNWNERRLDFVKVWLVLVNDLEERGLLQKYYDEIGYLFFREAYTGTIHLLAHKRYALKTEELNFMVNAVLKLFPDILENPYILKEENLFRIFFRNLLTQEITEEKVEEINLRLKNMMS